MQGHHIARSLRLWVLAWFVVAVGAAAASPMLQRQAMELICSGSGTARWVMHGTEGVAPQHAPGMECPLCLPADAPPSADAPAPIAFALPASAPQMRLPPPRPLIAAAHPPARAPPFFN